MLVEFYPYAEPLQPNGNRLEIECNDEGLLPVLLSPSFARDHQYSVASVRNCRNSVQGCTNSWFLVFVCTNTVKIIVKSGRTHEHEENESVRAHEHEQP